MAASNRKKAPARWAAVLLSGVASAGFLWGVVNAPVPSQSTSTTASAQVAAPTPTPVPSTLFRRSGDDDDEGIITELRVPSSVQSSTQPQSATQPVTRQPRLRTRGS